MFCKCLLLYQQIDDAIISSSPSPAPSVTLMHPLFLCFPPCCCGLCPLSRSSLQSISGSYSPCLSHLLPQCLLPASLPCSLSIISSVFQWSVLKDLFSFGSYFHNLLTVRTQLNSFIRVPHFNPLWNRCALGLCSAPKTLALLWCRESFQEALLIFPQANAGFFLLKHTIFR